jgi:DNA modification methylase
MKTQPVYKDTHITVYRADCRDILDELRPNSIHAIITDPPYGLDFMGKHWDTGSIIFHPATWRRCLRVLKPGGYLVAMGGTRTFHRLACAIEDAGFEIRDSIAWLYSSGFPKSLDVSKAIDKVNGEAGRLHKFTAWMRTTGLTARQLDTATDTNMGGHYLTAASQPAIPTPTLWALIRPLCGDIPAWVDELVDRIEAERVITQHATREAIAGTTITFDQRSSTERERRDIPVTDAAKQWQGWGTALKPAYEPIIVARKPLAGTVAANVLEHETGVLNIDACRIEAHDSQLAEKYASVQNAGARANTVYGKDDRDRAGSAPHTAGRWPPNVVLDPAAAAELDKQSGTTTIGGTRGKGGSTYANGKGFANTLAETGQVIGYGDSGGASRFFPIFKYTQKAPTAQRPSADGVQHPTVKPVDLMRWLTKLVVPPKGTVLDPFAGTGTTGEAVLLEDQEQKCILIEREESYIQLIIERLNRYEKSQRRQALARVAKKRKARGR